VIDFYKNSVNVLNMITTEQINEMNKIGYAFRWNKLTNEAVDNTGKKEISIYSRNHGKTFTVEICGWDSTAGEYQRIYTDFDSFEKLLSHIS
tara:strand:- start:50 stop:325 length:276 start_codon:yes stop_codon:yes gene_type:complete